MNLKNFGLSPAATDLGLGDMLQSDLEYQTAENRKRKRLQDQQQQAIEPGSASSMLLGGGGGGRGY